MRHLTIATDQSIQPIARIVNKIAESAFYISSIRVLPGGHRPPVFESRQRPNGRFEVESCRKRTVR